MKSNENCESGGAGTLVNFLKEWGLRIGLVLIAMLWLTLIASTWAEAREPEPEGMSDGTGDYSFEWLDPEKKIYVLQNRKFRKARHLNLSVLTGPGLNNAYRNEWNVEPRLAYYFSEALGVEFFYNKTFTSQSRTYKALEGSNPGTLPVVLDFHSGIGGTLQWVPWYAKINVFNQILYFDWYFFGGAGTLGWTSSYRQSTSAPMKSTDESSVALYFGTGHIYYLSPMWSIRLDLTGAAYQASIDVAGVNKAWFSTYRLGVGLGMSL